MTVDEDRRREWHAFRNQMRRRRLFVSWRVLEIIEQRVIPAGEMAERVSRVLERYVAPRDWSEWMIHGVQDPDVLRAIGRVLDADPDWLGGAMI